LGSRSFELTSRMIRNAARLGAADWCWRS